MSWSPTRIRCSAAVSASCPVTGTCGRPAAFIAAIAAPAVPSLAAQTPTTVRPRSVGRTRAVHAFALSGLHSAVSDSAATRTLPSSPA
jgi:hypothetical protein